MAVKKVFEKILTHLIKGFFGEIKLLVKDGIIIKLEITRSYVTDEF